MLDMPTNGTAKSGPSLSATSDFPEVKPVAPDAAATPENNDTATGEAEDVQPAAPQGEKPAEPAAADSGADTAANAEKGKIPKSVQKRIDELTREKHDERRAREALERRLAEVEQVKLSPSPVADAEPEREAFESPDEYQVAHTQWMVRDAMRQEQERQAQAIKKQRSEQSLNDAVSAWNNGQKRAIEKHPDYESVINAENLPIAQHVTFALLAQQRMAEDERQMGRDVQADGHDVAYYLGTHPDEAARISALPPYQAALAIGALSQRLNEPIPETPKPVKPVGSRASVSKSLGELSMDEYAAQRTEKLRESRKRR